MQTSVTYYSVPPHLLICTVSTYLPICVHEFWPWLGRTQSGRPLFTLFQEVTRHCQCPSFKEIVNGDDVHQICYDIGPTKSVAVRNPPPRLLAHVWFPAYVGKMIAQHQVQVWVNIVRHLVRRQPARVPLVAVTVVAREPDDGGSERCQAPFAICTLPWKFALRQQSRFLSPHRDKRSVAP